MKYRYKDSDVIVESGVKLDSAFFILLSDDVVEKTVPKKTTTRRKTSEKVSK